MTDDVGAASGHLAVSRTAADPVALLDEVPLTELKPELRIGIHASGIVIGVWSVVTGIIDADLPRLALGVLVLVLSGLAIRRSLAERRAQQRTGDGNNYSDRV